MMAIPYFFIVRALILPALSNLPAARKGMLARNAPTL
jgi:hypothetical protein